MEKIIFYNNKIKKTKLNLIKILKTVHKYSDLNKAFV